MFCVENLAFIFVQNEGVRTCSRKTILITLRSLGVVQIKNYTRARICVGIAVEFVMKNIGKPKNRSNNDNDFPVAIKRMVVLIIIDFEQERKIPNII